jgi:hypothetical protein
MVDLDRYAEWLRANGLPPEALTAHREGASLVLKKVGAARIGREHVVAAIAAERARGAPERRLRNLEIIGSWLLRYEAQTPAAPELELIDLPRPRFVAPEPRAPVAVPASDPICECFQPDRHMLDDVNIKIGGPIIFAIGIALAIAVGVWFSVMVDLGLVIAALCASLHVTRRHQTDDERHELRQTRIVRATAAAVLLVAAILARGRWAEERAIDQGLEEAIERMESIDR